MHSTGYVALGMSATLAIARLWQTVTVSNRLSRLERQLAGAPTSDIEAELQRFRLAVRLQGTPFPEAGRLLRPGWLRWLPILALFVAPYLFSIGLASGWARWDKEMNHILSLQPWEGIRAVQIVRHAAGSFVQWSQPWVSAGLACLAAALALALFELACQLWLARRLQHLNRTLAPRVPSNETRLEERLDEIERRLERLIELVEASSPASESA